MSTPPRPRIMLAEDEPIIAMNLEMALEEAGFSVLGPVRTCEEAVDLALAESIDCAVLDVELSGCDCTPALAALNGRGIPVVVTTGLRSCDLGETVRQGTIVLMKPFRTEQLLREVRRLVGAG